jgi:opacity protein-like surface antigen
MKCTLLLAVLVALCALPVFAQDYPKGEVFGGYQYMHSDIFGSGLSFNGWNASATANVNKWFGVTGDFSGSYKSENGASLNAYTYTFGPVLTARQSERLQPFVHVLFGGVHVTGSLSGVGSASTNGFAMATGGGVDAVVSKHLAVRLAQFDWLYAHIESTNFSKNVRLSTGIVFRF